MVDFERRPVTLKRSFHVHLGSASPGMIAGLLLVLLGSLLFVDNLDILPFSVAGAFWPLAVIAYSAIVFCRTGSFVAKIASITGLAWGTLLLLNDLHLIHVRGAILWPLVLIASGVILLMYRLRWQGDMFPWKNLNSRLNIGSNTRAAASGATLREFAIFSGVRRRVETVSFEGGELTSAFGSIEIDLRKASISNPERIAVIEANAAFGAIELRIPETWRVDLRGTAVFGAYEDKTIPPRPDPGSPVPTLEVRGGTAFGAVMLKN